MSWYGTGGFMDNIFLKKITINEIYKLKSLFPGTEEVWKNYKIGRLNQLKKGNIDVCVIECNGKFIGELTINYVSHDLPTETIPYKRVYLEALRLNKEYQGKGLGQRLIKFALDDLEKRGYCEFTIGVEDNNEIAKHIYFKYGFTNVIDKVHVEEYKPCDYTLYMRAGRRKNSAFK